MVELLVAVVVAVAIGAFAAGYGSRWRAIGYDAAVESLEAGEHCVCVLLPSPVVELL